MNTFLSTFTVLCACFQMLTTPEELLEVIYMTLQLTGCIQIK